MSMTDRDLEVRYQAACAVTREAGLLARGYLERKADLGIEAKGTQDLVSLADKAAEDLIRERLSRAFPDDAFVGEEGGADDIKAGQGVWIIDPIDGTMNFLRGVPYWSTVVAFMVDGVTEIGITADPTHDQLFRCRRGHGAMRDSTPIQVSGQTDTKRSVCGHTFSFKMEVAPYVKMTGSLLEQGCDHRRMGSTALMLCHVADGRLDGCVTLRCSSWDVVAGLALVREAGGVATEWTSKFGLTEPGAVLACTPGLRTVVERASGLTL